MNNFHKFIIRNKKIIIDGLIFIGIYISISYVTKPIREGANMATDIKIDHLDDLLFQLDNWDKRQDNLEDGKAKAYSAEEIKMLLKVLDQSESWLKEKKEYATIQQAMLKGLLNNKKIDNDKYLNKISNARKILNKKYTFQ